MPNNRKLCGNSPALLPYAYLQWSMSWPNAAFRPYPVIHNIRNPLTKQKSEHIIAHLPSFGEGRIYAKEQKLIDLVQAELTQNRPVVIFIRQTATRDIQPRIEALLRQHIPSAKPFILKNTVAADRREKVIEAEVAKGTNVILSNPELVKTGLDLVFAPTLIFYEITFNLGTMMQAAGRSLRLNQTHEHCKTYYLYCTDTMEETAVQLMSRKQRAAKLLNGDIGLTGLDALTEGEGGFEEALLDAIGREEALIDPTQLFKSSVVQNEIYTEDAAYWNVEVAASERVEKPAAEVVITPIVVLEPAAPIVNLFDAPAQLEAIPESALIQTSIQADAVLQALTDCGGTITSITTNSSSIMPQIPTKPPVKQAKKIKRHRINLLAVPADDPIPVLELLAGKATKPAVPAMPAPVVNPREVVQLALW